LPQIYDIKRIIGFLCLILAGGLIVFYSDNFDRVPFAVLIITLVSTGIALLRRPFGIKKK